MRKGDVVLSLILIGCPLALLATGLLIRPASKILQDEVELFEVLSSLTLITAHAFGWIILVRKLEFKSTTKILLYGYVVLFSIVAFVFMSGIMS